MLGTRLEFHPLAAAIPATVDGPGGGARVSKGSAQAARGEDTSHNNCSTTGGWVIEWFYMNPTFNRIGVCVGGISAGDKPNSNHSLARTSDVGI